jgi:hypothetical protein
MKLGDLIKILSTTSIPTTYRAFEEGKSPGLPFICIVDADTDNFFADGKVFHEIHAVNIELYTKSKDIETENKVKKALNDNEIPWQQTEVYIESEKCYEQIFSMEV